MLTFKVVPMMRAFLFFIALLFSTYSFSADIDIGQIKFPVEKFKLANGLTVLLHQDRSIPLVSYHTWYRVGSRDEKPGVTGAAHMLEHMMFKGAKKYSNKEFDRILHENGITNNAFTTWDYTGFYQNLPSHRLELMMDMEVDRMRFLNINPEDLKSELQVVGEERRWRVDNNPSGLLREVTFGTLYTTHPYQWPVIGHMTDIQAYTSEKLRHFYDTFYVPNNAVLVIAGDIDIPKTKALVEKYYGQLQSKELPQRSYPPEPEQTKEKRKTIDKEVQASTLLMSYKGVPSGHADSYALDLLANIMGSGSSSRLYKNLVYQKQIALGASSYNITNADPGVFIFGVSMKPGQSTGPAEDVLNSEIQKIQNNLVSEKELQKAKNQVMRDFVEGLTTIDGRAQALAINEIIFGSYEKLYSDLAEYSKITAKDIQRVAKQYFKPARKVVTILNPKKKSSEKSAE